MCRLRLIIRLAITDRLSQFRIEALSVKVPWGLHDRLSHCLLYRLFRLNEGTSSDITRCKRALLVLLASLTSVDNLCIDPLLDLLLEFKLGFFLS